MKINGDFVLREIAGETILIPMNAAAQSMNGMAVLNELGAFLWERLPQAQQVEELTAAILAEYDVDAETAGRDVEEFLENLRQCGILEN